MPSQDNRFGSVTTPLGKDVLLFSRLTGYEEMSRLFEYEVELLSEKKQIDSSQILGQDLTVTVELPAGGYRYYHGFVTRFRQQGTSGDFFRYRAILRPWLWFLTRSSNCLIFQELSVPDILKKIFQENGFSDFQLHLTQTYAPRDYCVQYRETDFNFVSRLMESEGIFYFFTHEQGKHTLVITDSMISCQVIDKYQTIPYFPPDNRGQRQQDHIFEWHNEYEVQAGRYTLNDFDFEKPKSNLTSKFVETKSHRHADAEVYDYPGNYLETALGDHYATARLEALHTDYAVIQGKGNAMGLTSGLLFTLKDHYNSEQNAKHVVTCATFTIESNQFRSDRKEADFHYECAFKAIPAMQQFRPQRLTPVPFVQGPQTAVVVGKSGEEIWTDKYGRVKVQFHWDREGQNNEKSSCWVRVSHPMAGKNWGWVSLPRIGQEVIVSFLEGNPDRPIITGRVYNAMQMPPYPLPTNQTQSGIKTRSSKEGSPENFNELRFEDKKGSEQVYLHAEKNLDTVVESCETHSVGVNRNKSIGNNETVKVSGFKAETIIKALAETVGLGKAETIGLGKALTVGVDYVVTVGKDITITAGDSITLKVGASMLVMKSDGTIVLSGVNVDIIGETHIQLDSTRIDLN